MNTEIHRVLRICIHFPMWFLPPSSFACLSWEIWSQLSSLPHTLSEQELLVYSMNFIHTINLYLWIIKILYSTALRGGKRKAKKHESEFKKKIFIHLQDKRNSYMSNCIQVHKSSSVTHTKHFPVFSESCHSIKSTVLLLKQWFNLI